MPRKILILGASYGSLLGTKLLMAGHDVTLVCRAATARLINDEGTIVRLKLKGESEHRVIHSGALPGRLDAQTPETVVEPALFDLVVLAMQEPQYSFHAVRSLLVRIFEARVPCLSLMNMPPLPYLARLPGVDTAAVEPAYANARVWARLQPGLVTLSSPDPQAFRPADEPANVLHVGLPTNFKAGTFERPEHNAMLAGLAADIESVRLDRADVPVKLKVHDSLFVPLAKWSMLLTGNYRCLTGAAPVSIREAVHADLALSRDVYETVDAIVRRLGATADELVPFDKYAAAAEGLKNPSSVARAVSAGAPIVERVDKLVQIVGRRLGLGHPAIDRTVALIDALVAGNRAHVA